MFQVAYLSFLPDGTYFGPAISSGTPLVLVVGRPGRNPAITTFSLAAGGADGVLYGVASQTMTKSSSTAGSIWQVSLEPAMPQPISQSSIAFAITVSAIPAIGPDETVYLSGVSNLIAIKPSGAMRWNVNLNAPITTSPIIGFDGAVYVGGGTNLWAINSDGSPRWTASLSNATLKSAPILGADGALYATSTRGLHAFDRDGHAKWEFPSGAGSAFFYTAVAGRGSPALGTSGLVYFVGGTNLFAVDSDGHEAWRFSRGWPLATAPVVADDGTIYIADYGPLPSNGALSGSRLFAIQGSTGPQRHPWPMFGHDAQHTSRVFQCSIASIRAEANGDHRLSLRVEPGTSYRVQASSDLRTWRELTQFTATASPTELIVVSGAGPLFFRMLGY